MWDILRFFIRPSQATETLLLKTNKYKMITICILILLYSFVWVIKQLSILYILNGALLTQFFTSLIIWVLSGWLIYIIWKLFWWKGKFLDILLITVLAESIFIVMNTILIFGFLNNIMLLIWMSMIVSVPTLIWYLIILSKWLSKVEQFSETKVTFTIILFVVILYFGNSFLSWITWISLL